MGCTTCFAKYILCLFNFIIFLTGGGILGLGVWLYFDKGSLTSLTNYMSTTALPEYLKQALQISEISYILMAAGVTIFVLSLLGYCGALKESRCLLGFYGFLLVVILLLEITACGFAFFYKDKADIEVKKFLTDTISKYDPLLGNDTVSDDSPPTVIWNGLMLKLKCCGVESYTDFQESQKFKDSGLQVPLTCCAVNEEVFKYNGSISLLDPNCTRDPKMENSYYKTGCYDRMMKLIANHMNIVIYCILSIVGIELLAIFFAFCLCKSLGSYDDDDDDADEK